MASICLSIPRKPSHNVKHLTIKKNNLIEEVARIEAAFDGSCQYTIFGQPLCTRVISYVVSYFIEPVAFTRLVIGLRQEVTRLVY